MTKEQRNKCHTIIHTASAAAAAVGGGLAQIPGSDNVPLMALETGMVMSLAKVFDIHMSEAAAKSVVLGAVGTNVGRAVSQFLVGWIPGVGNAINATTAAGVVEAMGWGVAEDFSHR